MRIQHSCLVDLFFVFCGSCLNGKELYIDIGHVHCRNLYGQASHFAGIDAVGVDHAGNFHTGVCRKVLDETVVDHIAADLIGVACDNSLHDVGSIFFGTLVGHFSVF